MDFSNITLFSLMKSKLEYLNERQNILAQNIANSNTPGYKARDVKEPDFKNMLRSAKNGSAQKLPMTVTDPNHMTGMRSQEEFKIVKDKFTDAQTPDGNNVIIEEEMSKMAMNQADYQKVLGMYGKAITMFKTAIGNTSGGA